MKESQHIEWKESWRDEYLRWISGFANAEGGVLVLGRNDKGAAVGVADAKKLLLDLPNKIRDVLGIVTPVNLRREAGKDTIEIVVEPYPYPVSYKGEYHVRSGSTKQELKGAALDRFLLRKQGRTWDGVPVPQVSIRSLSGMAIAAFRKRARDSGRLDSAILRESTAGLVDKLHLMDGKYLKRAAVLLFHSDPEALVTGAFVKIGFFDNVQAGGELLYHDEIHGDLFTQVDKTLDLLLTKYMKASIRYEGVQRIERFPVPEEALREAVLNAIIHKDYSSGTPIQISVYEDKLMLWNPGELPDEWTVAKLKQKHPSRPFNPDVANAFFRAGMIEAWGRGIERIVQACRAVDTPSPEFRSEQTGLWAEFAFPSATSAPAEVSGQMSGQMSVKISEKIRKHLLANPRVTVLNLSNMLGITERSVARYLRSLRQQGVIRRVGPDKGGHWEIRHEVVKDAGGSAGRKTPGKKVGIKVGERVGIKVGINVGEKVGIKLTANQQKILDMLVQHPRMAASELAEAIGISKRKIEQNVASLKKMGRLRRIGSRKTGHWEVLK